MLDRLANADTKVTFLLSSATAKYIRVASAGQEKTQSKFISDVLERYGRVDKLDMDRLRSALRGLAISPELMDSKLDAYIPTILSIFGIEEAGD